MHAVTSQDSTEIKYLISEPDTGLVLLPEWEAHEEKDRERISRKRGRDYESP